MVAVFTYIAETNVPATTPADPIVDCDWAMILETILISESMLSF